MVEVFQDFTIPFFTMIFLIALGLVFEKQAIAAENKLDAWFFKKFHIKLPFGKD